MAPVGSQGSGRGHPTQQRRWVQALQAGSQGKQGASRGLQRWPQEMARGGGGSPRGPVCALSNRVLLWAGLAAGVRGTEDCSESKIHLSLLPVISVTYHLQEEKHGKGNRSWRGERSHDHSRVDNHTRDCVVSRAFS